MANPGLICFKKADKVGGLGAALRPPVGPGQTPNRGSGVKPPEVYSLWKFLKHTFWAILAIFDIL